MSHEALEGLSGPEVDLWLAQPTVGLIKFWAPWCAPCRMMDTPYASVAEAFPQFRFATLNIDQAAQLATKFMVRGIPCIQAWKDGKLVNQMTGAVSAQALRQWVEKLG